MADLSIRNLDDAVKDKLRARAAAHGRSMESEIRNILEESVTDTSISDGLLRTILDRFGELGGVDLELPSRSTVPRAADLSS